MRQTKSGLFCLFVSCFALWFPTASFGTSNGPSAQALLAEQDTELVRRMVAWTEKSFELPGDMALDPSLRAEVASMVRDLLVRLRVLVPIWIAEERGAAKDPHLRGAGLLQAVYLRALNEMYIGFVESVSPAHDEAWLKAALAPEACRFLYPSHLSRRISLIQAAPIELRPALVDAEKELLARWGTARKDLPARPGVADLTAAEHAITRVREGLPVEAMPMMPYLAGMVFARDRKPGKPDRWEQCARSQWWLQSQLAKRDADRGQALAIYRYSTMPDLAEMVPASVSSSTEDVRSTGNKPGYPRAASQFQVEGSITLKVNVDNLGRVLKAEIVAREIRVPGVRNNRPLAFETLFDDAALAFAQQKIYSAGSAREEQFVLVWKLDEVGHGAQ